MLSVRDLLAGLEVRMLTGEAAADLPVRWVHISELLDPTPWLSGGEVLLTTGMLLDTPTKAREYLTCLADHNLAALGFGVGFGHEEVPAALIEVAEERGFPVFEVPYEVPFLAITEAAFTRLVNEQYAVLRRALAAQERLERIVLSERGLGALAGSLASQLGAAVLVLDAHGEVLAQHAFRRVLDAEDTAGLIAQIRERTARRESRIFIPQVRDGSGALALAVAAEGGEEAPQEREQRAPEAWLVAVKDTGSFSDFDRLTLHQAVTLIALELLRARVAGDTERRLAGDVIAGLASGELAGAELARRLTPFGLGEEVAALACRAGDSGIAPGTVEAALREVLRPETRARLVAGVDSVVCALVPGEGTEAEALEAAQRVGARLAERLGGGIALGVGRVVRPEDARRSFHEARYALETLRLRGAHRNGEAASNGGSVSNGDGPGAAGGAGRAQVASYRDIGSFQLLLSLQDGDSLRVFCDSILEPLERSEGAYGDELVRSLEAFIEENGQWERAAKRLFCHRHTLRYRIRRIEELTGRDLSSARDRIDFWLALRGRELVA